ncbi:D-2-hydroxyacid dehydrogenase, partial [Ilumatobacter sp.]|uniref:D-2-hydroxyacid dehydrogenase n=1 Tax=Ilumatobacter sp. TaxID=1967498 RepID=UPI003C460AC8
AAHPGAEVVWTPYVESDELRSLRERHDGRNLDHLETPDISDETRDIWRRTTVAVAMDLPDDLATLMPDLAWVQSITAGYEKYDLAALHRQRLRLTNASGLGAASIAEFVIARLLQVWKNLRTFDAQQDGRVWEAMYGTELTGRTIGIAGLGAIGRAVAQRARAFDMTVLATRASARAGDTDPAVDELFPAAELDTMLARCDAVVSTLPSNPTTIGLFDADRFAAMPPGAVFCNVGRGAHVEEPALIAALESGRLGAAALDVTRVEPLPTDDPLWGAPNLYLSPHSSVSLDRYTQNLEALLMRNVRLFLDGQPMINEVTLDR